MLETQFFIASAPLNVYVTLNFLSIFNHKPVLHILLALYENALWEC